MATDRGALPFEESTFDKDLSRWDRLASPPPEAMKTIIGGRIAGKTDINPQWRYKAMTEVYGECGVGWAWELVKVWTEPGTQAGEVFAFVQVNVKTAQKRDDHGCLWSEPVPGIGGAMLIAKEKSGLFCNDDAFKMATTDALSVALKFLGVGSLVYEGRMDGKNGNGSHEEDTIGPGQMKKLEDLLGATSTDTGAFLSVFGVSRLAELTVSNFIPATNMLEQKKAKAAK